MMQSPIYSPPHANANTTPAQWVLTDPFLAYIGEGVELLKYHRHTNKSAKRKFFYHRGVLAWKPISGELPKCNEDVAGVAVLDIVDITKGKAPNTFKHHTAKHASESLSFSIIYKKAKSDGKVHLRSVDFEAPTEEVRNELVSGLQEIVKRAHDDQKQLHQSDPLYVECKVDVLGGVQIIIWRMEDKMAQDRREEMIANVIEQTNVHSTVMPRTPTTPPNNSADTDRSPYLAYDYSKNQPSLNVSSAKGEYGEADHLTSNWESAKENKDMNGVNKAIGMDSENAAALHEKIEAQSNEIIQLKQLIATMEIESARKDVLLSDMDLNR